MSWKAILWVSAALLGALGIAAAFSPPVRAGLRWALRSMVRQPSDDAGWQQD